MELFVVIALVAIVLLLAELTLPTGGALAALGAAGLIASGVIALGSDGDAADIAGPARSTIDPEGQVWIEGALWRARLAGDGSPVRLGDRVKVEAIEGLTLIVRPETAPAEPSSEGAS